MTAEANVKAFELPESSIVRFSHKGKLVLETEAIFLDFELTQAQKDMSTEEMNSHAGRAIWQTRFRDSLIDLAKSDSGYKFTITDAWFVAVATNRVMDEMKKKLDGLGNSSEPTGQS